MPKKPTKKLSRPDAVQTAFSVFMTATSPREIENPVTFVIEPVVIEPGKKLPKRKK